MTVRLVILVLFLSGLSCLNHPSWGAQSAPSPASSQPALPVDVYFRIENGVAGQPLSTEILNSFTFGAGGRWVLPLRVPRAFVLARREGMTLSRPVKVGSKLFLANESGQGLQFDHSIADGYLMYRFDNPRPNVSIGMFFATTVEGFDIVDHLVFGAGGSPAQFCACNQRVQGGSNNYLRAHSNPGGVSSAGAPVYIKPGKPYWLTMLYEAGKACHLRLYDPGDSWKLVGESKSEMTAGPGASSLMLQQEDSGSPNAFTYLDEILMDWSNAAFPLGL